MPPIHAPNSDNLLLGKGEVFFNRKRDDGTFVGFRHMGNVETLELTTTDDVLEKYSSMDASSSLYKRVTRRRDAVLRVVADEFTPENLALVLMGETVAGTAQAATPVVGEVLTTSATRGAFYKTAKVGPITGVTVSGTGGALVLGTDYIIHNAAIGIIQILPGSGVAPGSEVTISYTPTAYADGHTVVRGGTKTLVEGAVLFIPDPTVGPKIMLEVWSASVAPDGALGLISQEFGQMAMTMAVQADAANHPGEPLYRMTYL
jgi:hypothetical protein